MGQCQAVDQDFNGYTEVVVGRERKHRRASVNAAHARTQKQSASTCQAHPINLRHSSIVSPKSRCFAEDYTLLATTLGHGMSGDVRLARCCRSGGLVAVKTLDKTNGLLRKEQSVRHALLREVDIHLRMDHANIVRLLQVFDEPDKIYLVMEYCSGGTLVDKLQERVRFDEQESAALIHQMLSAVNYCHCRPSGKVIHRDLKLANFVFDRQDGRAVLKLLDFGLSRVILPGGPLVKNAAGTLEFMAPEVLRGQQHGEACDLWAIGVMAYLLLSGELPFDGLDSDELEHAILKGDFHMSGAVWTGISESAKSFVRELLSSNPAERPSADVALGRPWMSTVLDSKAEDSTVVFLDLLERIEGFAKENPMRRAAAAIAVYSQLHLEGEDVELALKQFRSLDVNRNGVISQKEMTKVLQRELGISSERCHWVFQQLDLDGDREIHLSEFLAAAIGARLLRSHTMIDQVFDCIDVSKDGKIQSQELTSILGETFCGRQTKHIFSELDTNGDHEIDLSEFSAMVATPAISVEI